MPRDLSKHLSKEFSCLKEESLSLEVFRENRTPIAFFLAKTKIYTISSENTKFLSFSLADYISKISEGFALFSRKKNKSSNHNGREHKILQTYYYSR